MMQSRTPIHLKPELWHPVGKSPKTQIRTDDDLVTWRQESHRGITIHSNLQLIFSLILTQSLDRKTEIYRRVHFPTLKAREDDKVATRNLEVSVKSTGKTALKTHGAGPSKTIPVPINYAHINYLRQELKKSTPKVEVVSKEHDVRHLSSEAPDMQPSETGYDFNAAEASQDEVFT